MYITLVLFTALLAAIWGWRKGLFLLVLRLAALVLAYALAWQETPALAGFLEGQADVPVLLAWPAAALLLFIGGGAVFGGLASWLASLAAEHWDIGGGRWSGGLLGAALGCGLGMLLVWTVGTLQDSWQLRQAQAAGAEDNPVADTGINGKVRQWSGETLATLAGQALGDSAAAPAAKAVVRNPVSMGQELQYLARKPELQRLLQDPVSYGVLVRGAAVEVMQLADFRALVNDERLMHFLVAVGLPGQDHAQQVAELANILTRYVGNYERLRNTPEFQAMVADPELRAKLQQGNLLTLLTDARMRQMAAMLAHGPGQATGATSVPVMQAGDAAPEGTDAPAAQEEPARKLYRWKDANGHLHITDQSPPEGVEADVIQP